MDAYHVARLIEEIGETSARTEKERLTKILAESEIGRFVLEWAYNPFITFGITVGPASEEGKFKMAFKPSLVEPLLKKLASRELTGNAAAMEIAETMGVLDKDAQRLLYLILAKDLKCGIGETTINSVVPGLVPVFSVMRAHHYEPKKVKSWPVLVEYKLDGQRNTFLCKDGNGGFFTRSGKRVPALDFLVPIVLEVAILACQIGSDAMKKVLLGDRPGRRDTLNFMLDGEAMMGLFEATGAFRRENEDAVGAELHLYDMMSYEDFDAAGSVGDPLKVRRALLKEFVAIGQKKLAGTANADVIQISAQFFADNDEAIQERFEKSRDMTLAAYMARGNSEREEALLKVLIDKKTKKPKVLEGVMVKNPDGLYDKKKTNGWLKLKAEETKDLTIIGVFSGKPDTKYEHQLGGAVVDFEGMPVRIGGGWSDEERELLWEYWVRDAVMLGIDPNVGFKGVAITATPKTFKGLVLDPSVLAGRSPDSFDLITRLIETEFMEPTPDGSLRHPRYVRFRDDKAGEVEEKLAA
jgi:ATP-dependent DNA ligase